MKYAIRLFSISLILAGCIALIYLSLENNRLAREVNRLEAELGKMPIKDPTQVTIAEIANPTIPPEVASHIKSVWQFRCYLPPKYDFLRLSGSGLVTPDGLFLKGGHGSGWGSPSPNALQTLLTVSFQKKGDGLEAFYSLHGTSGTTAWNRFNPVRFDTLIIQKLVNSKQGPRSFNADMILPLLRVYDPTTAENTNVAGRSVTTYPGGYVILCPKSRQSTLNQLLDGQPPADFDPKWVAAAAANE